MYSEIVKKIETFLAKNLKNKYYFQNLFRNGFSVVKVILQIVIELFNDETVFVKPFDMIQNSTKKQKTVDLAKYIWLSTFG